MHRVNEEECKLHACFTLQLYYFSIVIDSKLIHLSHQNSSIFRFSMLEIWKLN